MVVVGFHPGRGGDGSVRDGGAEHHEDDAGGGRGDLQEARRGRM